jgi:hypothetical protein
MKKLTASDIEQYVYDPDNWKWRGGWVRRFEIQWRPRFLLSDWAYVYVILFLIVSLFIAITLAIVGGLFGSLCCLALPLWIISTCIFAVAVQWTRFLLTIKGMISKEIGYFKDVVTYEKTYYSDRYGLKGRLDALIRENGKVIPVEFKDSVNARDVPFQNHKAQLAAYLLLLEENGERAEYGYLKYTGREPMRVDYTPELKARLLATIGEMRHKLEYRSSI